MRMTAGFRRAGIAAVRRIPAAERPDFAPTRRMGMPMPAVTAKHAATTMRRSSSNGVDRPSLLDAVLNPFGLSLSNPCSSAFKNGRAVLRQHGTSGMGDVRSKGAEPPRHRIRAADQRATCPDMDRPESADPP